MPAPDLTTYIVVHDLSRGNQLGVADAIEGYMSRIPDPLYAGDSFRLELLVYEKYSATSPVYCDWPNNTSPPTTAKLYVKHADTDEDPVLVSTGTISTYGSTGKRCVASFNVYAGDLPTLFVSTSPCLIYVQIADPATGYEVQTTIFQRITMQDHNGTGAATLETKDIDTSIVEIAASCTLTAYAGPITYLVSGASAAVAITLPTTSAGVAQELTIHCVDATNPVTTVAATINGVAGTALSLLAGDTVTLFYSGTAWFCLNYGVIVRP
jgi:hypothetical protein